MFTFDDDDGYTTTIVSKTITIIMPEMQTATVVIGHTRYIYLHTFVKGESFNFMMDDNTMFYHSFSNGDKIGFRFEGDTIYLWKRKTNVHYRR